jgi:hypothetical protein
MEAIKNDILVYDLEGNLLEAIHDITIRELAEMFELDYTGVVNHLNGHLLSAGRKYQFKRMFKGTVPNRIGNVVAAVLYSGGTKVHKFYKGRYIASYESLSEASLKCNLDVAGISKCINGIAKSVQGFTFRVVLDPNLTDAN